MGVNAIALLTLLIGILYLGEYHRSLIEARLETFKAELELVSTAIGQSAMIELTDQTGFFTPQTTKTQLDNTKAKDMVHSLGRQFSPYLQQRIRLFNKDGVLIADSQKISGPGGDIQRQNLSPHHHQRTTLQSIQILKDMAGFIVGLLPQTKPLPVYPQTTSESAKDYPDADTALNGRLQLSAWLDNNENIFLSAAMPIMNNGKIEGIVLMTRSGIDIESDIANVWFNIIGIFIGTLFITVLLSIYLSGQIESPLRRLIHAANHVRLGYGGPDDIPDLSHRNDEIGRLSLVLRDMTSALWQRLDMMERFAADVSHELKNPLTSLKSAVETAAIVKKKADRDKLTEIIKHDIHRLDRLITDIAHASRLDTELARESFSRVNIRKLMIQLMDQYKDPLKRSESDDNSFEFSTKYEGKTIRLNFISSQAITIMGNEGRLMQVMNNLLSNALSFTPKNKIININIIPLDQSVHIVVEDQGPGIPQSKLDEIFARFYSERPDHEDYGLHSGLGLSICKQIIDAHNGAIHAENIKNDKDEVTGARFTVILKIIKR